MEFEREKCYTTDQIRTSAGVKLSKEMFGHIRYVQRLIPPPPYKVGGIEGVVPYYPERVLNHLRKLIEAKKKGLSYREIKENFTKETNELSEACERLKNKFEAYKKEKISRSDKIRRITSEGKGETLSVNVAEDIGVTDGAGADARDTVEKIRQELKEDFKNCDYSLVSLSKIKQKITKMEAAQNADDAKKLVQAELDKTK